VHPAGRTIRARFIDSAPLSIDIGRRIYRLQEVRPRSVDATWMVLFTFLE
jgi:hypothetical protein